MRSIRILIADEQAPFRRTLRSLVESQPGWEVCGEAADGLEAVEKARELRPQIVLMDLSMPGMDGSEATRNIGRELPECKVIVVSQNDPRMVPEVAGKTGAHGCVSKADLARDLVPMILRVVGKDDPSEQAAAGLKERADDSDWLFGGGNLAALMREHDWSSTPLGPLQNWPQSLRTAVNLMLNSQHPMWIGWGPKKTFLYNDAYISVLSLAKHPWALGKPADEVWAEIWDVCGPLADKVFTRGEPSFVDDVCLFMNRGDYLEETYYSFSYSPIYDESGKVAGLFCPSTETTAKNLHARRLRTLSELSAKSLIEKSTRSACGSCIRIISQNPEDIPFALLYLLDGEKKTASLEGASRVPAGLARVSPPTITLGQEPHDLLWPIREVAEVAQTRTVTLNSVRGLPLGPAHQSVREAVVLPVTSAGMERPIGVLIAGVNPTRKLDPEYRTFFSLIADQVATAVQNARAVEQEKDRADALAQVDRAKTAFFSNVSHEFRTPLTLMLGPLEDSLAAAEQLPADHRERLEVAYRNSVRLLRLVNTLLDFSRLEAGRIEACYEPTDLPKLTAELASMFRSATERAGLQLIVNCPPITEAAYVDREMWEKIVFNLLSNAFKFTFQGEIEISVQKAGGRVELAVRDTGTGIPEHELPHLFERFHRVKGASGRTFEGSGIGLSLVQELVKLHSGELRVKSKVGEGSTFTVSIPLGKAHLAPDRINTARSAEPHGFRNDTYVQQALSWLPGSENISPGDRLGASLFTTESAPAAPPANAKRYSILLADDNADMRAYVQRVLSTQYQVTPVADGESALESAREQRPDLIVSDIMMPRLDGLGLLQAVRREDSLRGVPVILLSARAGEDSRLQGVQSGADDYLVKPFSARELLSRVQAHLDLARLRQESEAALSRRTAQFETLLNEAPLGVYLIDSNFHVRAVNPRARHFFGNLPGLIGRDFGEMIHTLAPGAYGDEIIQHFRHTLETGEPYSVAEQRGRRQDLGGESYYEWQINRILLPEGGHGVVCYFRDISRMVQAREKIRESEERFKAIVETTPECVKVVAADGTLLHMNAPGLRMVGAACAEDVVGGNVYDLIAPEYRDRFRAFNERICGGERGSLEFDMIGLEGARRHMETHAAPLRNPDGSIVHLAVTRDVTERKKNQEALRESQGQLALALESSSTAMFDWDIVNLRGHWNPHLAAVYGFTPQREYITAEEWRSLFHPADVDRLAQEAGEAYRDKDKGKFQFEFRAVRPDGQTRWILSHGRIVRDARGRALRMIGTHTDITDRKRVEQAERSAHLLAAIVDSSDDAIISKNLDGFITSWNKSAERIFGYTAEEAVGQHITMIIPPDRRDEEAGILARLRNGEPIDHFQTVRMRKDGGTLDISLTISPVRDFSGKIVGASKVARDITQQMRVERALRESEERFRTLAETLEAEVRARTIELENRNADILWQSEQLRDLSRRLLRAQDEERRHIARELHDSAGQTLTVLALKLAQLAHQAREVGPDIEKEAENAQQLVLQLSQEIRTTSYLLHPPLLDESGLSSALGWYVQGLSERSGLEINLEIGEDVGRLPREIELVVFRLVQECLTNIHRHSASKIASIRIVRGADVIAVEVQDQGRGISPERLLEIQGGSSGVGIRGMRERLRQFGGNLNIESGNSGTRISVSIPLQKGAAPADKSGIQPLQATV